MFNIYQLNIVRNERLHSTEIITEDTFLLKYLSTIEKYRIMFLILPMLPLNMSGIHLLLPNATATPLLGATVTRGHQDSLPTALLPTCPPASHFSPTASQKRGSTSVAPHLVRALHFTQKKPEVPPMAREDL